MVPAPREHTECRRAALGAARGILDLEKNVAFEIASYLKNAKGVALPEEKN